MSLPVFFLRKYIILAVSGKIKSIGKIIDLKKEKTFWSDYSTRQCIRAQIVADYLFKIGDIDENIMVKR